MEFLILGAFIIDVIFGDPPLIFPHPIRLIGLLIEKTEGIFYNNKRVDGIIFTLFVIVSVFLGISLLIKIISFTPDPLKYLLLAILGSFTLSLRSLHIETERIYNFLEKNDIYSARKFLSYLVSRDTNELEYRDIVRSVIETISENLVDGVISPLFYFAIGGIKLAFLYKAVNTLDSMIGYRNDRYREFGYFSAKLDDILNFIPARIAGFLVIISAFLLRYDYKNCLKIMLRDHDKTDSPNSGWSEAAFAGALNIQLGGPTPYFGIWYDKPTIGDEIEKLDLIHVKKSFNLLYLTSIIFLIIILFIKN